MFEFKTYYENFSLDNPTVSLTVIIWAICIGLSVGVVLFTLSKWRANELIKALVKGTHNSPEAAVSLGELGIKASPLLRKALREGQPLRKYVCLANPEECLTYKEKKGFWNKVHKMFLGDDIPPKCDLGSAGFYILEASRHTAEIRYESKGNPIVSTVISCVLFMIIAVALTYCMPWLLDLVDSMITAYKNL